MATKPKPNPKLNPTRPKANPALAVSKGSKIGKVTGAGDAQMEARRAIQKYPGAFAKDISTPGERMTMRAGGAKAQLTAQKTLKTAQQTRKGK